MAGNPTQPTVHAPSGTPDWLPGVLSNLTQWVENKLRGPFSLSRYASNNLPSATNFPSSVMYDSTVNGLRFSDVSGNWQGVYSGTYTPTLTGVTNVSASTPNLCQFMRVGNVVTVSGSLAVTPSATGATKLGISLPIATATNVAQGVAGVATCATIAGEVAVIDEDITNKRAQMDWVNISATNHTMFFTFTYLVS